MARSDVQINIRIPEELKARLDASAGENRRSLTAEIVARLEYSYHAALKPPEQPDSDDWERVRRLARMRDDLTAKLTMLNAMSMQVQYEIRSAHADGLRGEHISELQRQVRAIQSDSYSVREQLDKVTLDLDRAYAKVDGHQPTGTVKISKAD